MQLKQLLFRSKRALHRLYRFIDDFNNEELFLPVNYEELATSYVDLKIDDLEEFCVSYTYLQHERKGMLDNNKSKKKMYLDTLKFMRIQRKRGMV